MLPRFDAQGVGRRQAEYRAVNRLVGPAVEVPIEVIAKQGQIQAGRLVEQLDKVCLCNRPYDEPAGDVGLLDGAANLGGGYLG